MDNCAEGGIKRISTSCPLIEIVEPIADAMALMPWPLRACPCRPTAELIAPCYRAGLKAGGYSFMNVGELVFCGLTDKTNFMRSLVKIPLLY